MIDMKQESMYGMISFITEPEKGRGKNMEFQVTRRVLLG